jgi:hypothetical protein
MISVVVMTWDSSPANRRQVVALIYKSFSSQPSYANKSPFSFPHPVTLEPAAAHLEAAPGAGHSSPRSHSLPLLPRDDQSPEPRALAPAQSAAPPPAAPMRIDCIGARVDADVKAPIFSLSHTHTLALYLAYQPGNTLPPSLRTPYLVVPSLLARKKKPSCTASPASSMPLCYPPIPTAHVTCIPEARREHAKSSPPRL